MALGVICTEFKGDWEALYIRRYNKHIDELKWLYMELYSNESMFSELCYQMHNYFNEREEKLKNIDAARENTPDWYRNNYMIGMRLNIESFSENIKTLEKNIEYLQKCNINFVHLMPFFDVPENNDGEGYAVSDFRKVKERLGTIEDFKNFTMLCHEKDINICVDFVMNQTSKEHEWARRALQGDSEYTGRYIFMENQEKTSSVSISSQDNKWNLNYKNPRVFNEMMNHFLYLANTGADVIQTDYVEYIWKEAGSADKDQQQVHTILRMMRIISEIVCPGILLLADIDREMEELTAYFGVEGKPECHMLYNKKVMPYVWNAVAMRDIRLLRKELDDADSLPKEYLFVNYLRNENEVQWSLDYEFLKKEEITEKKHREYLNNFFRGYEGYSSSRGELYWCKNQNNAAGFCGTTASMCGLEKAVYEGSEVGIEKAIRLEIMLYAYLFMRLGVPVIYSGDEIGQINDYSYSEKSEDSSSKLSVDGDCMGNSGDRQGNYNINDARRLQRGKLDWKKVAKVVDEYSIEGRILRELNKIENVRKSEMVFGQAADITTIDTGDNSVLGIVREFNKEKIIGIFNFSENDKEIYLGENAGEDKGMYEDLTTAKKLKAGNMKIEGYGFYYLKTGL